MSPINLSTPQPFVCLVRLGRPEKLNALTAKMVVEMAEAMKEASKSHRCIVLTGNDRAFSAGADIANMERDGLVATSNHVRDAAWAQIGSLPVPVISAVNGIAYGGGLELALLTDFIVAGGNARFAMPEVSIGGIPGDGGTQRLARLIGRQAALRMILTGQPIEASEALRIGLVTEVVPSDKTVERSLELASVIAENGVTAIECARKAISASDEMGLTDGLAAEKRFHDVAFEHPDRLERMRAFFQRRKDKRKDDKGPLSRRNNVRRSKGFAESR